MISRLVGLIGVTVMLAACSLLPTATTVSEAPTTTATGDPNGGNPSTGPTATSVPLADPVTGVIVVTRHAVIIVYDESPTVTLTGDIDYPLASAFVDLTGGLVFQYSDPGPDVSAGILRLLPGTIEPTELIPENEGVEITLLDVAPIDGRPTVIYLSRPAGQTVGGQLLAADIQGGAPLVLYDGPDLVSGDIDEALIVVELRVNATCNKLVAFTDGESIWDADCNGGSGPSSVAVSGSLVATVVGGDVVVTNLDDTTTVPVDAPPAARVLDLNDRGVLLFNEDRGLIVASEDGQRVVPTGEPISSASLFNSPLAFTDGHRLGGIQSAQGPCSAAGQSSTPDAQAALPEAVQAARAAIVERAVACDFDALASLVSPSFTVSLGGGDARRFWLASEAQFGDDLSLIVRILNLPFARSALPDGRTIYVWPSAASGEPTEAQWQALRPVFNEEEIDAMRREGSYSGHRIGIAEDGEWLFSVSGE